MTITEFKNKVLAWFKKYFAFLIPVGLFLGVMLLGKPRVDKSQVSAAKTDVKDKVKIVDKQTEVVEDLGNTVEDDIEDTTNLLETQLDDKEARDEKAKTYFPNI